MKYIYRFLMMLPLIFSATALLGQDHSMEKRLVELHERKWQYLVEHAQLSPGEIELVKPVFLQYENALWIQHEKNRAFFRSALKAGKDVSLDYAKLNDQYAEIEYVQGMLFRNYHQKLKRILKPETLFLYYKAERDFKRKLLHDLPHRLDS